MCRIASIFLLHRLKEACQATRAISTTSRRELSKFFSLARQDAEGNSRHSDRNIRGTCNIVFHRQKLGGRSQFFVRRGGHCCRGDLVARTTFCIFFLVACKS